MLLLSEFNRVIRDRPLDSTINYRGWHIVAQTVKARLWIRCQHPLDAYPLYGIPALDGGIADAIERVKSWIDTAILIEQIYDQKCAHNNGFLN